MKKRTGCNKKWIVIGNRFAVLFHAAGSLILYFVIEWISRHSFSEAWSYMTGSPLVFLYNALLIFMTTTIVFLFRRRIMMRILIFGGWLLLGIVNGVVLANRVTPFTGPDLKLIDDLKKIIGNYMSIPLLIAALAAIAVVIVALIVFWFKGPKYKGKRNWVLDIALVAGSIALFAVSTKLAISSRILSTYFGNIAFAYEDYGYPYCLSVTIFDTGISQPNGYSEKLIDSIAAKDDQEDEEDVKTNVNIVFLQLESFFDPETVNFLNISEDPIPYFRSLTEEYSSGYYRVPAVGAGTANTEFESISGMSLHYFGPGEYPYKTILKEETCESIPYILKEYYGYSTHAIHNNEATFYDRNLVYPMLGFDSFTSEEYMSDISDTTETGWVKDHILTQEILNCLNSTDGADYVYTVSVQGHGDYPTEPVVTDPEITVTGAGDREKNNYSWEYYCKQIHEMDEFLEELTDTLEKFPEKTVLVMYGDHLPTMGLETKDMENHYLFQTQYVIWDNFGLEKEDEDLCSYQIGAEVLNRLGMHKGTMVSFHQSRKGTKDYQTDMEVLQYDMLYGDRYVYGGSSPFQADDMTMGVLPITLTSIEEPADGIYILNGSNFTASSAVEINGKVPDQQITRFDDSLILQGVELKEGDEIAVVQQADSSSSEILSETNSLVWHEADQKESENDSKKDSEEDSGIISKLESIIESGSVHKTGSGESSSQDD